MTARDTDRESGVRFPVTPGSASVGSARRSDRFRHIVRRLAPALLAALAVGCDGAAVDAPDSSAPSARPASTIVLPSPLRVSRIRPEDITLEVLINGRSVQATRDGVRWSIDYEAAPGTDLRIELAFSSGGVPLASATRSVEPLDRGLTIAFGQGDYLIADDDDDGFSNIDEIDAGSDPFRPESIPVAGPDAFAIAGLYDASILIDDVLVDSEDSGDVTTSFEIVDEVQVAVFSDGSYIVLDYLGDNFDQGPDCYDISVPFGVRELDPNRYDFGLTSFAVPGSGIARFEVGSIVEFGPGILFVAGPDDDFESGVVFRDGLVFETGDFSSGVWVRIEDAGEPDLSRFNVC